MSDLSSNCSSLAINTIANLLQKTLSSSAAEVKAADSELSALVTNNDFLNILFKCIVHEGIDISVRLAGSIYLKNLIKKSWPLHGGQDGALAVGAADGGNYMFLNGANLSEANRNLTKENILQILICTTTSKCIYVQMLETLNIISEIDFPLEWSSLLPFLLNNFLNNTNSAIQTVGLEILESVLQKYKKKIRNNEVLKEMKFILNSVQTVILSFFKYLVGKIKLVVGLDVVAVSPAPSILYTKEEENLECSSKNEIKINTFLNQLLLICKIFYYLNVIDIPEFFEDNIQVFFDGFCFILKNKFFCFDAIDDEENYINNPYMDNVENLLKVQICENMTLYSDKYQEEFLAVVTSCIFTVTELIENLSKSIYQDDLFCAATNFLSSASKTNWNFSEFSVHSNNNVNFVVSNKDNKDTLSMHRMYNINENFPKHCNPFQNNMFLKLICEIVIFKNLILRKNDIAMLEEDADEYIRRNIEGGDKESRRSAIFNLIKSLNKLYADYTREVLMSMIESITKDASYAQDERCKETLCFLITALSIKTHTIKQGIIDIYPNVNFFSFYENHLKEELCNEYVNTRILIRSSAIKFIQNFRNFFPAAEFSLILKILRLNLQSSSPVVHTYAAYCLEKIFILKSHKINIDENKDILLECVKELHSLLLGKSPIKHNEFIARCFLRLINMLKYHTNDYSMMILNDMISIVKSNSSNPSNLLFIHYIFEIIAVILKLYAHTHTKQIEEMLLPVISVIVEQGAHDFLSYCLQILGILLYNGTINPQVYVSFFEHLLNNSLWVASSANVPGIISLLAAFFEKHEVFEQLIENHMESILKKFQYCLYHRKLINSAFELLNNIFYFLPIKIYLKFFQTLLVVLLKKLQEKKDDELLTDGILVSFLIFTCHNEDAGFLPRTLNTIQPGLNDNFGQFVLIPAAKEICGIQNRIICAWGFSKLLCTNEYRNNAELYKETVKVISKLIAGFDAFDKNRTQIKDDAIYDYVDMEYEISFSRLKAASPPSKEDFFKDVDIFLELKKNISDQSEQIKKIAEDGRDPHIENLLALLRF